MSAQDLEVEEDTVLVDISFSTLSLSVFGDHEGNHSYLSTTWCNVFCPALRKSEKFTEK